MHVVVVVGADGGRSLARATLAPLGQQALQQAHYARRQRLVALVAARHDAQQQRDQRQQHARLRVALVQQRALQYRRRPQPGSLLFAFERTSWLPDSQLSSRGTKTQQYCSGIRPRTSLAAQTSGCMTSASGGALRMSRSRHSAAFLRTIGRTAPLVCAETHVLRARGRGGASLESRSTRRRTSRFITSSISSDAISCPPTARRQAASGAYAPWQQRACTKLGARTVAHKAKRQAVEGLVAGDEVVADGVE